MQLRTIVSAVLLSGGVTLLAGCSESGTPASETTATPASATSTTVAPTTEETETAAPAAETNLGGAKPITALNKTEGDGHSVADLQRSAADIPETRLEPKSLTTKQNSVDPALFQASRNANLPQSGETPGSHTPEPMSDENAMLTVHAEPATLDIGDIPTGESGRGTVKLINDGPSPVKLVECRSSCGCTAAKCPRGQTIEPGESLEVEVSMTGLTKPSETQTQKVVRFVIEGQPQLSVPVTSRTVSFVNADPWEIDKDTSDVNSLTLTSTDGKPFRIVKMHPPLVEEFSEEPQASHKVELDWAKWEELGSSRRLTFYMDHPRCDKLFITINYPYRPAGNQLEPGAAEGADGAVTQVPNVDVAPPQPIIDPSSMIKAGKKDELLKNIEDGTFDLEETDRAGASLLAQAAHHNQYEIVKALLEKGANLESTDKLGKTPLMWAGHSKNADLIHTLLDAGADVSARDQAVGTALSWTAAFGDAASVRALLDAGSDANVLGNIGYPPLIWASVANEDPAILEALIQGGADVDKADRTSAGATALMYAAQTGKAENARVLLEHGAKIELQDNEGKTPLLIASEKSGGNVETIKVLIEGGANLEAKDLRGRNALDLARTRTDPRGPDVVKYLEQVFGVESEPGANTPPDE